MRRVRVIRGYGDLLETEMLEPYERRRRTGRCPWKGNDSVCPCEWETKQCSIYHLGQRNNNRRNGNGNN